MSEDFALSQHCSIWIDGEELPDGMMEYVEQIRHKDKAHGANTVTIDIVDPNYVFIASAIITEYKEMRFEGGWEGDEIQFEGYISVIDIDYPVNGKPIISLKCLDKTHLMNRKKRKRSWDSAKVSDVVEEVVSEYGFEMEIEETEEEEDDISQSEQTDAEFIQQLAENTLDGDYIMDMRGETFYFKERNFDQPQSWEAHYKQEDLQLKEFSPRINKEKKLEKVEKEDINYKDKEVDKGEAGDGDIDADGDLPEGVSYKRGYQEDFELD